MEQALVAAGLDFRCLTFDVHPDWLKDAVAGMRAMGFLGAILADPHQVAIGPYLDEVETVAQQASYVDFVTRVDDKLCGQSTLAAAIAELLTRLERMPKSAVIFGTTPRERLIAAQLVSLGIPSTLVDTRSSDETPLHEADRDQEAASSEPHKAAAIDAEDQDSPADQEGHETEGQQVAPAGTESPSEPLLAAQPVPARAEVASQADYEADPPAAELVLAASAEIPDSAIQAALRAAPLVAMDLTEEPVFTDFLKQAKGAGCVVFNSVDIRLTSLVIAFRRWTNVDPDESLMRDALEEFLLV